MEINHVTWTPDRKQTVTEMWTNGKTSGQIADVLGDVSRSAVMGMVNRLGLLGSKARTALKNAAREGGRGAKSASPNREAECAESLSDRMNDHASEDYVDVEAPAGMPNGRTTLSLVEEMMGQKYDPSAKGHRTTVVAIAAMLGDGAVLHTLPHGFPADFACATMRRFALHGILAGGEPPQHWLDPELGDLSFLIDMLFVEGVLTRPSMPAKCPAPTT
ncbi:GcrA family cell cycle regulator [Sphingomonas sp. 3-13AW]|uniref:GcrA family cell cycle regulator n=1 Tax=Sphingomonas sp. 3-13AW TaxID=3050450 RepID=UPI003BB57FDC